MVKENAAGKAAAPPRPPFVDAPLALGPDWFNTLFAHRGPAADVTAVEARAIGTGQVGTNVRYSLGFRQNHAGLPQTLVGKFQSQDEKNRMAGKVLGLYEREYRFYDTFAGSAARIAPGLFYSDYDEATDRVTLLMEDMAPAVQGDQLAGCTLAQAELAMDAAAVLHASHWNDPMLDTYPWLQFTSAAPPPMITPDFMAALWPQFKDRYGDRVSPRAAAIGDAFVAGLALWAEGYRGPKCLSHGDFRLDNMLFGGRHRPLAVVDWQTLSLSGPANDVAYFLGAGLVEADRRRHEEQLVRHYHTRLREAGITDYPFDALWRDYRWFSFSGLQMAFAAAILVEQTARGDAMFLTMLHRHADQIETLGALSLLSP
ncbi:DUF1679 domain-containing protein [Oleomonas cavernae]|uniref:DUF1679 domain-containing protein n=1 Tax=Oleomonas cavernae TaxID=2320859 RepID=A0A418WCZ7_9PROT|nr:phosphotransferase [Oleomonas cavernae]RJF87846.1 DUF1679 domain-containing protein [Oleomonas cavernae]